LGRDNVSLLKYLNFLPDLFFSCFGGVFVYIDSNLSSKLKISYNHNLNKFEYLPINPKNKKLLNKSLKILFNNLKKVKILPFKFMIKNYYFGSSNHLGGQFPHSLIKQPNKTDIYGRLDGLERVFIVDSSVLPKVNTGPLTFTIMANSKRICKKILEF
jgi:choline dehydrogenase-like flavoprotein